MQFHTLLAVAVASSSLISSSVGFGNPFVSSSTLRHHRFASFGSVSHRKYSTTNNNNGILLLNQHESLLSSLSLFADNHNNDNDDMTMTVSSNTEDRKIGLWKRVSDTMTAAGFSKETDQPLLSIWGGGPKRMFIVFTCLMTWKWFRAKFLLKQKFTDKQPAWGHVITSADQEEVLHAWTCKECGTTMFIAKGREIRFFNRFVECYNCGAKGKDAFFDRRQEIAERDDTNFEYENPMDYVSQAEQKKMEKEMAKAKNTSEAVTVTATAVTTAEDIVAVEEEEEGEAKEQIVAVEEEEEGEAKEQIVAVEEEVVEKAVEAEPTIVEESVPEKETPKPASDGLDVLDMDM